VALDVISFVAAILFDWIFPDTFIAPNEVVPPDDVEVSDNQARALGSPSVGHTYSVESFVLYQS
jgi:hypothetical protein